MLLSPPEPLQDGYTPLLDAASKKNQEGMKMLIAAGADVNIPSKKVKEERAGRLSSVSDEETRRREKHNGCVQGSSDLYELNARVCSKDKVG